MRRAVSMEGILERVARVAPSVAARLDWLDSKNQMSWGGPMNGQPGRQNLTREIMNVIRPSAVVETGTHRGTTTLFLAHVAGVPLYSSEASRRYHAFAQRRITGMDAVHLYLGDSRDVLRELASDRAVPSEDVFFYLDAHWDEDLPLWDELDIIFDHWQDPLILVDDFEVPGDADYQFDDYGPGKRLCAAQMPPSVRHRSVVLYPSLEGRFEGGARRGCGIVTTEKHAMRLIAHARLVRSAPPVATPRQGGGDG